MATPKMTHERETYSEAIPVRLTPSQRKALLDLSRRLGRNQSEILREAVVRFLRKYEGDK